MKKKENRLYRADVLRILSLHRDDLATRYGVTKLGIFGSVARDEATEVSDVDVVLEMRKPDLIYMVHIKEELEKALHRQVDIVHYRKRMNEFLQKKIHKEAVYV